MIEEGVQRLEEAFPPTPLESDGAFAEWGGTYTDAQRFKERTNGKRWTQLDPSFLEQVHDSIVFLGPSTIADYLPAFLAAVLRQSPELDALPSFLIGTLTRTADGERFDARFAKLTTEQRHAVARVLLALERQTRARDVTEALNSYWRALED